MATQVRLKAVRTPTKEREAENILDTVQEIIDAVVEGVFDPYIDILWKSFDDRIRKSQEEDGDGEAPIRDRADKLRPIRAEREPVAVVEGRHYRLRGEKHAGVVVEYIEMAGANRRGAALVLVEVITGNQELTSGKRCKVPLIALEEIPDLTSKPVPKRVDEPKCRSCGQPVEYSGRGRPRNFCDNCLKVKN